MSYRFFIRPVVFIGLSILTVGIWWQVFMHDMHQAHISFFAVGQGDATFIETPTGHQILIDGGQGSDVLQALGSQMGFFDRSIDVVIATHPDKDHIGGLLDVLSRYDVSLVLEPGVANDTGDYEGFIHFLEQEKQEGAQHVIARRGQVLDFGDGSFLRILFPDRDLAGVDPNDASIIAQFVYGDTEVLLTGDAPKSVELYLLSLDGQTLASDVLKVGHHGSDTSSAGVFTRTVDPEYAVISAGKDNRFGHPHQEVLDTLETTDAAIFGTYDEGTITFISDGKRFVKK